MGEDMTHLPADIQNYMRQIKPFLFITLGKRSLKKSGNFFSKKLEQIVSPVN